jgi:hypothetical protein
MKLFILLQMVLISLSFVKADTPNHKKLIILRFDSLDAPQFKEIAEVFSLKEIPDTLKISYGETLTEKLLLTGSYKRYDINSNKLLMDGMFIDGKIQYFNWYDKKGIKSMFILKDTTNIFLLKQVNFENKNKPQLVTIEYESFNKYYLSGIANKLLALAYYKPTKGVQYTLNKKNQITWLRSYPETNSSINYSIQ